MARRTLNKMKSKICLNTLFLQTVMLRLVNNFKLCMRIAKQ